MRAQEILQQIEKMGIEVVTGVPDSTLKQFCDGLQTYEGKLRHYVTVNEGAAVGVAIGTYLGTEKPACVYMQNSGIGNAVNPIASLAHAEVYGIPMLFIVGWRGEPGIKDEPQHVFQGRVTCQMFETLEIPYEVIGENTTEAEMALLWDKCGKALQSGCQFAIIVKKNTFSADKKFEWENGNPLNREHVLGSLLKMISRDALIVSTTGKISRELYEQSDALFGSHDNLFMTVGGMGHASMIAFGLASARPDKGVFCIDGDGAALMHMGSMAFMASQALANLTHIVINNMAHESVGAMPTGCQGVSFAEVAKAVGYRYAERITDQDGLDALAEKLGHLGEADSETGGPTSGPVLYEIMVGLGSRKDLGRPKETARENRNCFIKTINV
ncbi:MAG: phosphonopyruvate decarboxylase [Lachnospiraceae bacterium]|nr:phosphonopyruvate decarboxylase [Lachnospiraceae bacterium]